MINTILAIQRSKKGWKVLNFKHFPGQLIINGHLPYWTLPLPTFPLPDNSLTRHLPYWTFPLPTFPLPDISLTRHFPYRHFPYRHFPYQTFPLPTFPLPTFPLPTIPLPTIPLPQHSPYPEACCCDFSLTRHFPYTSISYILPAHHQKAKLRINRAIGKNRILHFVQWYFVQYINQKRKIV